MDAVYLRVLCNTLKGFIYKKPLKPERMFSFYHQFVRVMYRVAGSSRNINTLMAGNLVDTFWTVSSFVTHWRGTDGIGLTKNEK